MLNRIKDTIIIIEYLKILFFELNLCELNDDTPAVKFNKAHNNPKYKIGILIS